MEENKNYITSFNQEPPVRNKIKPLAVFLVIFFAIIVVFIFATGIGGEIISLIIPGHIPGKFMDAVYYKNKDGQDRMLIVTDGSFHYIQTTKTPGSYSMGRKGLFCKTHLILYDPINDKIISRRKIEYDILPASVGLFNVNNKILYAPKTYTDYDIRIYTLDPETGNELTNTETFIKRFPLLSSGISLWNFYRDDMYARIHTKDGNEPVYDIPKDVLYENLKESQIADSRKDKTGFYLIFSGETQSRKTLQYITDISDESYFNSDNNELIQEFLESYKTNAGVESEKVPGNNVFLEGVILAKNQKYCVIFHQDKAGDVAKRLLSCVNTEGKVLWTKNNDELFSKLEATKKNAFSKMVFMKNEVNSEIYEDKVLFKFDNCGFILFDLMTGKEIRKIG